MTDHGKRLAYNVAKLAVQYERAKQEWAECFVNGMAIVAFKSGAAYDACVKTKAALDDAKHRLEVYLDPDIFRGLRR